MQIVAILLFGLIIGVFAERNHVFGYADNTPIIPAGTYKTTSSSMWKHVTIRNNTFITGSEEYVIVDNRFTNKTNGRLVLAQKTGGNRSLSYFVSKIKEGWKVEPIVNGKPYQNGTVIFYVN